MEETKTEIKTETEEEIKEEFEKEIEEKRKPSAIEKTISEMNYDFDFDDEYEPPPKMPKVRLWRYITVGLAMEAERNARITFDLSDEKEPTHLQMISCKLALVCKFDGKKMNAEEIGVFPESFLHCITGKFIKALM